MSEDTTTNATPDSIPHPADAPRRSSVQVEGDASERTTPERATSDGEHGDRSHSGRGRRSGRRHRHRGGWARRHRRGHGHRGRRHVDWDDIDQLERHQRNLEQRAADTVARIDEVRERIRELDGRT